MKIVVSTIALVLSIGTAQAQGFGVTSASEHVSSGEGTVGAMQAFISEIATSPDDVMLQQRGMATAARGSRLQRDGAGARAVSYAPGTVGAAPGSTGGR